MADLQIRIMLLVGSNGKASACIEGANGWGDLADNIMDYPTRGRPTDPDVTSRHIVAVTVAQPAVSEIQGALQHQEKR